MASQAGAALARERGPAGRFDTLIHNTEIQKARDPNPAAHEASQTNPVGGPGNNPLPPACSPELPNTDAAANSLDGTQCPANKLVITRRTPIRDGAVFTVTVRYTGRPGVHNDGDGTTEGWFRAPSRPRRDPGQATLVQVSLTCSRTILSRNSATRSRRPPSASM